MGDEPTRAVQHEGEAGFPTLMSDMTSQISLRLTSAMTTPADARLPEIATSKYGSDPRLSLTSPNQIRSARVPTTAGSADRSVRLSIRLRPIRDA